MPRWRATATADKRVRDVVIARHRQGAAFDHDGLAIVIQAFALQGHVEMRDAIFIGQVDRAHIGLRVEAKGHDRGGR